jgi:chitin disaccharide deacetylase
MSEKCLIINADDFGMSRGISDGILLAHRYGVLTSTSLMVNMPASEYAVERLSSAPRLSAGVHLNICQGRPISAARDVPTLVNASGDFHPPALMVRKLWRWQVSSRDLEREFLAQISWMQNRGLVPTHADSHHHMHIYPAAAAAFARAVGATGIRRIRAPRCSSWPKKGRIGGPHQGGVVRRLLVQSYRSALQITLFRKFHSANSRISFSSEARRDSANLKSHWMATFEHLPEGIFEFACHPGLNERSFSERDPIHLQRERELQLLTEPELRATIVHNKIALISYRQLSADLSPAEESADRNVRSVA